MKKFLLSLGLLLGAVLVHAQVTTSSINGTILEANGQPSIGASVRATHVPSGTVYGGSTNENGRFNIANMRVGGPYTVQISYVGSEPATYDNLVLQLGQPYVLNVTLQDGVALDEVIVTATGSRLNTNRTGASTNVSTRQLSELPQISRSVTEFTRLTPQASGNSFAGRDGRYNNLQIDGANFNNGFGLNDDPLPGRGSQPISLDAIEEIQVNIAPYDILQSGFTGAGINAVTRSGTNTITGSAYGFYRNQNLQGRRIGDIEIENISAATRNYGFRLGGPIIKNKLFFFVNAEREEATGANASGANPWRASQDGVARPEDNIARTRATDLDAVRNHLINTWGYDPGRYEGYANEASQASTKFLARIDWNINEKHKLAIRYNQVVGVSNYLANASSGPRPRSGQEAAGTGRVSQNSITFENGNYSQENTVRSVTAELNSNFNSQLSNQFLATYTRINDIRRTPSDQLFPFVDIWDGSGIRGVTDEDDPNFYTLGTINYMSFGTELFSYRNDVINNNYSFINNLTYTAGKHTITAGGAFEIQNFGNSYTRMGTSYYRYNSVADFLSTGGPNEVAPIMFGLTYPYEGQDTYARINFGLASLYVQDRFDVNDRLSVTAGLRAELPIYLNKLTPNLAINSLTLLNQFNAPTHYDSGLWPKSRLMLSPRLGFNYDVNGDRTLVLRGGTGVFSGRVPFVWLTNMPTGAGVLQNTIEPGNYDQIAGWIENVNFNPDPYYHLNNVPQGAENVFIRNPLGGAPGSFSLVDRNFRMPMVWRSSLGGDFQVPNSPIVLTADLLYTRDINAVFQYGANRAIPTSTMNYGSSGEQGDFGDNRLFYPPGTGTAFNPAMGGNNATVLTNTSVKGDAFSATFGATIPSYRGFSGSLFYTYSAAREISSNSGSSASSAWGGNPNINSPNDQILFTSPYAIPHRIVGSLNYRVEYANSLATTIGVFYNGAHQGRFSYTYGTDINNDGTTDLLYLPRNTADVPFVDIVSSGNVVYTVQQQRDALDRFIADNGLESHRGGYLRRNDFLIPWLNRFDVRVLQDLFVNIGGRRNTLQLSVDVVNAGNLLNRNWGIQQNLNGAQNLLSGIGATPETGIPALNMRAVSGELAATPFQNASTVATTWSMQFGLRYIF